MKNRHFWIQIAALSSAVALAIALLFAVFGAATVAADPGPAAQVPAALPTGNPIQSSDPRSAQAQEETYEGVVTDTHCGAKHEARIDKTASDCTRACVHAGEHFALVDGDKVYILNGDLERLKRSAGQRSKIVGRLIGDTISVSAITAGI